MNDDAELKWKLAQMLARLEQDTGRLAPHTRQQLLHAVRTALEELDPNRG